ncbi:MAG: hypothetical protein AAF225_00175 [Pseudomonadota bacterium]
MNTLTQQDDQNTALAFESLTAVTQSYNTLACGGEALEAAVDCLLDRSGETSPRNLARVCMTTAGLTR